MSDGAKSLEDSNARNEPPLSPFTDQTSMKRAELDPVQTSLKDICDRYIV